MTFKGRVFIYLRSSSKTFRMIIKEQDGNNQITVPGVLIEKSNFCNKIIENNAKVYGHVEYLRDLVGNMHSMYSTLCKHLIHHSEDYERKIAAVSKQKTEHSEVILEFVKSISFLHFSIGNQLSSNSVTLGTKTHRIARNRLDLLKERLTNCHQINAAYLKDVEEFNKEEKQFRQKCNYFEDYEKDVLKYYSMKANVGNHQKLQTKEIRLKQHQEEIFQKKQDYQANVHQIRAGIKDYFQLEKNIIAQYSRLLLNVRKKLGNKDSAQLYAQPIMEEPSDQMNTTTLRGEGPMMTNRSERPAERNMIMDRKEIIKEEEKVVALESFLNGFLKALQQEIKAAGDRIDEMRSAPEYQHFINDKLSMTEILSIDSIREIDLIINEISLFRTIILNINTFFGRLKVLQEIRKYRIHNYNKFIEETVNFAKTDQKGMLNSSHRGDFYQLVNKYIDRNNQLMAKYRDRVVELQNSITSEYYREQILYSEQVLKKRSLNNIFDKPYYEILLHPFFLNRQNNIKFVENPHLKKLSLHLSANQIQNSMTLDQFYKTKKRQNSRFCCGLFSKDDDVEGPKVIDEYHCALKDGLILIQGKMKLFENYLNFTSSFNSKTLFGFSDIRVPKWDILQILNDKHLLSLKIVVQTTHGNLEFTSFLNSPYEVLMHQYQAKKNGISTFHKNSEGDTQVALLEERFQSDFPAELLKVNIVVDKLSTYLSEDRQKLSISIEYHLSGSSCHSLFEIKIIEKGYASEYIFIHDQKCRSNDIKSRLEEVSKKLINRKKEQQPQKMMVEEGKEQPLLNRLEYSIIEANQNNKLSFQREPSFIYGKGDSFAADVILDDVRLSQLSLGPFLTSKQLETSRNENDNKISERSPPQSRRESSNLITNRLLLESGRVSGDKDKLENKEQETADEPFKSKFKQATFKHTEETRTDGAEVKRSKGMARMLGTGKSSKSSKSTCEAANYKLLLWVIGVVFALNLGLKVLTR